MGPCAYNVLHDQAQPVILPTLPAIISGQKSDHGGAVIEFGSLSVMSVTHTPSSAYPTPIHLHISVV